LACQEGGRLSPHRQNVRETRQLPRNRKPYELQSKEIPVSGYAQGKEGDRYLGLCGVGEKDTNARGPKRSQTGWFWVVEGRETWVGKGKGKKGERRHLQNLCTRKGQDSDCSVRQEERCEALERTRITHGKGKA